MRRGWRSCCAVWLLLVFSLGHVAMAQSLVDNLPRADRREVRSFALDQRLLDSLIAVVNEAQASGIRPVQSSNDPADRYSLAAMEAYVLKLDPRIEPLLTRHGTNIHEMLLTRITMGQAAFALQAEQHPELGDKPNLDQLNPANVRFYAAHLEQISRFLNERAAAQDAAASQRVQ